MSLNLHKYDEKFTKLNVNRNKNRYTAGKAPHKAVLLLSLILLEKEGKADLRDIRIDTYLLDTWSELWSCLEYDKAGPIYLPLYHMKSDGFWHIEYKEGQSPRQPRSMRKFTRMVERVHIEEELLKMIHNKESRNELINALLNGGYFSDKEKGELNEKIEEIISSFKYEKELEVKIEKEFTTDPTKDDAIFKKSRNSAFRRLVVRSYLERCCVCGMKLVTSSGISIIDAAHILPFSKFHNDDLRNGLALCKIHHWLFDRGIISVDQYYRTIVSRSIETEEPEKAITEFSKKEIILPHEPKRYPSQVALEWHRGNVWDENLR